MLRTILELALDFAHDLLAERERRRQDEAAAQAALEAKLHELGTATRGIKEMLERFTREGKI